MNSRKDIQRELELISNRLPFDVRMPVFDLPENYFENFAAGVLAAINGEQATAAKELSELSPLLAGLSRKMPYSLPENYFTTTLAGNDAQAGDPTPGWSPEGRNSPYGVPAGYFTQLPDQLLERVQPAAGGARVVPMFARRWVQYAAAAVVTGALVLGGLLYSTRSTTNPAEAPEVWVAQKLRNVSNQELEAFILNTGFNGSEMAQQGGNSHKEVRHLLNDVPNSELEAFLNQLPAENEYIN